MATLTDARVYVTEQDLIRAPLRLEVTLELEDDLKRDD